MASESARETGRDPRDTPAMRQYYAFKKQHPGCVLFFRMGDFYEMFDDDAVSLSKALGLTLTKRQNNIPMAGVPHHQKESYLRRAIEAGFRVAVVDQVQDPRDAKGVVDRAVTQVVTPGTLVDEHLLTEERSSVLGAVAFGGWGDASHAGVCLVELATGVVRLLDASGDALVDELARGGVSELLYASDGGDAPERVSRLAERLGVTVQGRASWQFRRDEAMEAVRSQYGVSSVEGFGLAVDDPALPALGAVLRYLQETQGGGLGAGPVDGEEDGGGAGGGAVLRHLSPPRRESGGGCCSIDHATLRALEIERTLRSSNPEGSLLGVFLSSPVGTRCVVRTAMGKRLLRAWLCRPLSDADAVRARQRRVSTLVGDERAASELGSALESVQDVARIAGRLGLGRATPRDVVALGRSLEAMGVIEASLANADAFLEDAGELRALREALGPFGERVRLSCVDEPPPHMREGGLFRDGFDAELDEARGLQRDAGAWLAEYQSRLVSEHNLPSLKVGFNKVFGYYIELPAAQAKRAPDVFTRKQTLKNAERYITPELKAFEDKVTTAEARAVDRERVLFESLCGAGCEVLGELARFGDVVARTDVVLAFADKARGRGWVAPEIVDGPTLRVHGGRHPVLDELLGSSFVPNDCELGDEQPRLALVTGPNMAGKSTYIRQTALLALLALTGSFVPADRMVVGALDRIAARVGADDALHRGQSTFMVEMVETAAILNNATDRSLIVLDEIGRGTSTLDGLSLAWAIAEALSGDVSKPLTLFATHYHELTRLADERGERVRNLHVVVREWTGPGGRAEIIFQHLIEPGRADQSYGVHVARLAGVPPEVTDRAAEVLNTLKVHTSTPGAAVGVGSGGRTVRHAGAGRGGGRAGSQAGGRDGDRAAAGDRAVGEAASQLALFAAAEHPVVGKLRALDLESLSPMQAFDVLRALRGEAE